MAGAISISSCVSKKDLVNCQKENVELNAQYQNTREQLAAANARITSLMEQLSSCQGNNDALQKSLEQSLNAANSGMTGCYQPCHSCIDNCIHTYAGVLLRLKCAEIMGQQGYEEPTGQAKITSAYNLPCDYVIHTVGPIVRGELTREHCALLESCYRSCLKLADENGVGSIAFCCISTGVFMFPNDKAAEIAVDTVRKYKTETGSKIEVVFNVFKECDEAIYRKLLH